MRRPNMRAISINSLSLSLCASYSMHTCRSASNIRSLFLSLSLPISHSLHIHNLKRESKLGNGKNANAALLGKVEHERRRHQ